MKSALVCGAGGFIGHHMVNRLKDEGYFVRGVDIKYPEFEPTRADDIIQGDLRDPLTRREPPRVSATRPNRGASLRLPDLTGLSLPIIL